MIPFVRLLPDISILSGMAESCFSNEINVGHMVSHEDILLLRLSPLGSRQNARNEPKIPAKEAVSSAKASGIKAFWLG